jgi:hypothetical protein
MRILVKIGFCLGLWMVNLLGYSQNLDKLGTDEALKVTGGLSFNTIAYAQKGLAVSSREPFTWFAGGNLNFTILDVALPFTFTYSNLGAKYTQPFNRVSLNPSYKWVKTQIGITSVNYSPYTVTGHLFLGGAVEMKPGDWTIQLLGGRFNKAVDYNPIDNNLITYRNFGYGLRVGYEKAGYGGTITLFKAADQVNSIQSIPLNSEIKPQDNLVMSIGGKAKITSALVFDMEYALSALTQNTLAINDLAANSQTGLHRLINGNETTSLFNAYNAALKYNLKFMSVALKYEHIDPGYKTLGGYYFNNDLENYTLAPSFSLFNKKLNLGLNTGYQRNNLSEEKQATTARWVGSLNVTFVPSKKLVLTGNYSNFSTFTRNRPATDPFYFVGADTLNFYQLTQAASGMAAFNFGTEKIKRSAQVLYSFQESTNLSGKIDNAGAFGVNVSTDLEGLPSKNHVTNMSYSSQWVDKKLGLTFAGNYNRSAIADQTIHFFGPTLNAQKALWDKKGSLSCGATYNRQYQNTLLTANIVNYRISFSYNPKLTNEKIGKVTVSTNANLMQRFAINSETTNLTELNLFVNLNYSF